MADKKIESFLSTVYSAAEKEANEMIREIDRAGKASLKEYQAEIRRYVNRERRREFAKARRISARSAAEDETEVRKAILSRREAITDEVFDEIKLCLEKYRKTDDYRDDLIRDALSVAELISGKEGACILIGTDDAPMAAALEAVTSVAVATDPSITLGGLRGVCDEMETDCTYDTRLLLAREDFTRESGLSVV